MILGALDIGAEAQEKTEILIGTSLPMSGAMAGHGREIKWAYEQAIDDVNAQGGVFVKSYGKKLKARLLVEDNQWNKDKSAASTEKLITVDNADFSSDARIYTPILPRPMWPRITGSTTIPATFSSQCFSSRSLSG